MRRRLRLTLLVARPAVVFLLAMSGLVGLALAGRADDPAAVVRLLVEVTAFVVYAVCLNDLADLAVDRVNLPGDRARPLVTGAAASRDAQLLAAGAAVVTVSAAVTQGLAAVALTLGGLVVAAAYSLPPWRLSRRGVVAPLVLPALFVGVPFCLGVLAGRPLHVDDLALLVALYVGFIGRIVLKDFRDVVGDRMFGKRTFLVRHGRAVTCALSAGGWTGGTLLLVAATPGATWWYAAVQGLLCVSAVALIRRLARTTDHRSEERLVSTIAIVGRAGVVCLFVQLSAAPAGALVGMTLTVTLSGWLAAEMLRRGPRQPRVTVTDAISVSSTVESAATGSSSSEVRGFREPANDVTASVFGRPVPSSRQ